MAVEGPFFRKKAHILLFVLGAAASAALPFLLTFLRYDPSSSRMPVAVNGLIDLSSWDFSADGPVPLSGEWSFFSGALLDIDRSSPGAAAIRTVPDLWKGADAGSVSGRGAGTYRLRVLLPPGIDGLALRWATASTAFAVFADGRQVASVGRPALDRAAAKAAYRPGVAALPEASTTDGEVLLSVDVSNHEYRSGGLWRNIVIGDRKILFDAKRSSDLAALLALGILVGISIQQLAVYLFRPVASPSWFLFLFIFSVALRTLVSGEYLLTSFFPSIPFELLIRLEYAAAYLIIPFAAHFFGRLFSDRIPLPVLIPTAPFLLLVPFAPLPLLTYSILFYYPVALASIVYLAASSIRSAFRRRQSGTLPLLLGAFGLLSSAVNDMLFASFKVHTGNLLPVALVVFCILMTIALSRRYVLAFGQIERLLAEKETYLKEMHHRVKNSLQIVASVMSLQANRVQDQSVRNLFSAMRERVRSVALVHEKLHASLNGNDVDIVDYIGDLVRQVASSYGASGADSNPRLEVDGDPGRAPIEFCVDLGLAMTESLINSFKHAGAPTLVSLRRAGGSLIVEVRDEGPGFPHGFDIAGCSSLGFKIMSSVVRRRGGEISAFSDGGAVVSFTIPIPARIDVMKSK